VTFFETWGLGTQLGACRWTWKGLWAWKLGGDDMSSMIGLGMIGIAAGLELHCVGLRWGGVRWCQREGRVCSR
jgi:hypothetical protein